MMSSVSHERANLDESFEIRRFRRLQRRPFEVRNDRIPQVVEASDLVLIGPIMPIKTNASASEEGLDFLEDPQISFMLADREARTDFESGRKRRPPIERDQETSFSINESGHVCFRDFRGSYFMRKS
jgi:hypothetical protein